MAYYEDRFTFLYVDDARTSQEAHLRTSMACYRDSSTFYFAVVLEYGLVHLKRRMLTSICRERYEINVL
jgi:hypothetical protein